MPLNFDNSYFRDLTGFYATTMPKQALSPELVVWNEALADRLGLADLKTGAAEFLSGSVVPEGANPIAQAYAGHQFGHFSPKLGDGRAVLLGEHVTPDGMRVDVQLKGSGRTPFSRSGDGRYALGPALREHLVSEAMAAFGIETTRSLGVALTGEQVARQTLQPGAVLSRVAKSHIRVGTFQFFATHLSADHVRQLADYAIARHYPGAAKASNPYLAFFEAVLDAQLRLIASWIQVGFVHGVMNTDNMSILGLTIDYGPYGFLDDFQPDFICNHSDYQGRYSFENQPAVGLWNLQRLAQSLSPFISAEALNAALDEYQHALLTAYGQRMRDKLGLFSQQKGDNDLLDGLFALMIREKSDYTRTFRLLSHSEQLSAASPLRDEFIDRAAFDSWFAGYRARLRDEQVDDAQRQQRMQGVNPALVLRNWLAQRAIEQAEAGDMGELERLHAALADPFTDREDDYVRRPPDWGKRLEVSCSS